MTAVFSQAREISLRRGPRAAVFTMGALHAGHLSLMERARELVGAHGEVLVTIFVNPTQFNDATDLENYPRTLDADVALCQAAGVDIVFAPSVEEMYPPHEILPKFSAGDLGSILEGASRPGHFDAVATVVHRLLTLTQPDFTVFGEKDFQQVAVVRKMVAESHFPVEVISAPTVREPDGLAMSSRNIRLKGHARQIAQEISRALEIAATHVAQTGNAAEAQARGQNHMQKFPEITVDYFVITTNDLQEKLNSGEGRILTAVVIDGVRLIDNVPCRVGSAL